MLYRACMSAAVFYVCFIAVFSASFGIYRRDVYIKLPEMQNKPQHDGKIVYMHSAVYYRIVSFFQIETVPFTADIDSLRFVLHSEYAVFISEKKSFVCFFANIGGDTSIFLCGNSFNYNNLRRYNEKVYCMFIGFVCNAY